MTEYAIYAHLIMPMDCCVCEHTLSQAAGFPLSGSAIAQFPSMIKAAEKKGLCHMLVNDHKLEWVQGDE